MYRERAIIKFRRYFLHGIREGKIAEEAADQAIWKTREEILADLAKDKHLDAVAKEAAWAACFELLTIIRVAFVDYDTIYEERKRVGAENTKFLEQSAPVSKPESVAAALIAGMEQRVEQHQMETSKEQEQ